MLIGEFLLFPKKDNDADDDRQVKEVPDDVQGGAQGGPRDADLPKGEPAVDEGGIVAQQEKEVKDKQV